MPMITQTQMLELFVALSLFAIPAGLVLKKMGRNPAWGLLCYVPVLALIGLWMLALGGGSKSSAT
jgi:hypothetical protein